MNVRKNKVYNKVGLLLKMYFQFRDLNSYQFKKKERKLGERPAQHKICLLYILFEKRGNVLWSQAHL